MTIPIAVVSAFIPIHLPGQPPRMLMARRDSRSDFAGLWESPGGKVEAGESPEHALLREIREELGCMSVIVEWDIGRAFVERGNGRPPAQVTFFEVILFGQPQALAAAEVRMLTIPEIDKLARESALMPANRICWPTLRERLLRGTR